MPTNKLINNSVIREIVHRVVETAHPEKIILFGSAAREDDNEARDIDVLVVKSGVHRRSLAMTLYRKMVGLGRAVDIVVVRPEDVDKYEASSVLVIGPALREGKLVYEK